MHTCPTCGQLVGISPSPRAKALLEIFLAHEGEWLEYETLFPAIGKQSGDPLNLLRVRVFDLNRQLLPVGYRIVNARFHRPHGTSVYKLEKWQS